MRRVGRWLRAAGELVLPRVCGGCGREGTWWCARCAVLLEREPHCLTLDTLTHADADTDGTDETGGTGLAVRCACVAPYRGVAGSALVAMKERGAHALVPPLAAALAVAVVASVEDRGRHDPDRGVVLVPAPSRPSAVRARGADAVSELARACAAHLSSLGVLGPVSVVRCLVHRRSVADQASLDVRARSENLAGALAVRPLARPLLAGRAVVVVDDVLTTGATLVEAVRAVRAVRSEAPSAAPAWIACATVAAAGPFGAALTRESGETLVARVADG